MLRSLQIENFKAFGQRTVVPLAPITILFGQNSSGKSSILQCLNLLKQTRENRNGDALLLPRAENGLSDLGGFQEMVFDHDLKRAMTLRLDVSRPAGPRGSWMPSFARDSLSTGLEFTFARKRPEDEITLEGFKVCGENLYGHVARFEKCNVPANFRQRFFGPYRSQGRGSSNSFRAAKCTYISDDPTYWQPGFERAVRAKSRYVEMLERALRELHSGYADEGVQGLLFDEPEDDGDRKQAIEAIKEDLTFFSADFSFRDFVHRLTEEQLGQIVVLDGFLPDAAGSTDRRHALNRLVSRSVWRPGMRRDLAFEAGGLSLFAARAIEDSLKNLFPLGPFRKPPARWYVFTGTTPQDVGYEGRLLPDLLLRKEELRQSTNEWLAKLDIGYEIRIRHHGDQSSDLFELRLVDKRRSGDVDVGLADVGFGISQILPFIVQSLAASDQIITVEQPEVHIHPRLQADLGDLLVQAIREPLRNQFIIETHSEHMALRLQRRVREKQLSPDDISIVYVSRGPNGAVVKPLRLDEEGDFTDDFPGGFFPERLRELR
jgi:hypothetical protein